MFLGCFLIHLWEAPAYEQAGNVRKHGEKERREDGRVVMEVRGVWGRK